VGGAASQFASGDNLANQKYQSAREASIDTAWRYVANLPPRIHALTKSARSRHITNTRIR
jgi:hypothetical protein